MSNTKSLREQVQSNGNDRKAALQVVADLINGQMMQSICAIHYQWVNDYQEYKLEPPGSHDTFEEFLKSDWVYGEHWDECDPEDPESRAEMAEAWESERSDWLRTRDTTMVGITDLLDQADEIACEFKFPFSRELALTLAKDQADSNPKWDESRC